MELIQETSDLRFMYSTIMILGDIIIIFKGRKYDL